VTTNDPLSTAPYGSSPATGPARPEPTGPTQGGPGGAPATTGPDTAAPERHRGRALGRTLALGLLVFVTVVLVLFVVFNTETVPISLVFGDVEAPLVLALVIAAALGGLLVWLAGTVLRARRRNR
jgi:uncharacterized integral membrane protein